MVKHTSLPWINIGYRIDVDIADGLSGICEMSDWMGKEKMEANAEFIVRSANSHYELLEACKIAFEMLQFEDDARVSKIVQAIAKAETNQN